MVGWICLSVIIDIVLCVKDEEYTQSNDDWNEN